MYYAFKHLQKLGLILKLYFVLYCEKSTAQSNGKQAVFYDNVVHIFMLVYNGTLNYLYASSVFFKYNS